MQRSLVGSEMCIRDRPIENGGRLASDRVEGPGPWALFGPSGTLLAVHEKRGGRAVPSVVLPAHH